MTTEKTVKKKAREVCDSDIILRETLALEDRDREETKKDERS